MNYDEQIKNELEREREIYIYFLDMLENGDIAEDFSLNEIRNRIWNLRDNIADKYNLLNKILQND